MRAASEDDFFHETMGLGREESSFDHTRDSHSGRYDRITHNRAARANARGLLGCHRDPGLMQSTLGATLTLSIERIAATAVGASVEALEANYFRGIWSRTRLRSFWSDYCRSRFVWRRPHIVTRALRSRSFS